MSSGFSAPTRPDWRWSAIAHAESLSDPRARGYLDKNDEVLQRGFSFKKALDIKFETSLRYPDMTAAYKLYMGPSNVRGMIEGYLLTGADDERIAESFCCRPETVAAYHDLFFDVRSRLHAYAWISSAVFGDVAYTGVSKNDRQGMLHRIAWMGGLEVFESVLSPRANIREISGIYRDVIERALVQNSLETAISAGNNPEVAYQLLATTVDKLTNIEAEENSGSKDQDTITAFVQNIGITVADPTNEANLKLPAREIRESEYEVTKR
jgi:hypothetical protein